MSQIRSQQKQRPHRPAGPLGGGAQRAVHASPAVGPLAMAEARANTGPWVHQLRALRDTLNPNGPAARGEIVQRTVAEDVANMNLGQAFQGLLARSPRAQELVTKADAADVSIRWGGSHAQTARLSGGGIRITIPRTNNAVQALESIVFELNNAVRYDRLEAPGQKAVTGEIADEDEFAREKIKVELEGMLTTGRIGLEARDAGANIPLDRFYLPTLLTYSRAFRENPFLTRDDFIRSQADEVLDRPHQAGSHRQVYAQQFRNYANPDNQAARYRSQNLKGKAGQILTMAMFSNLDHAVRRFVDETADGPAVAAWVARHQEATRYSALHEAFENDALRRQADALNTADDVEAAIQQLGKPRAVALYSWVERNDEGKYRNLSQVLGLYLGYYDNKPGLPFVNIYQ